MEGGRRGRGAGGKEEGVVSSGLSTRLTQHILYTLLLSLPLPASSCPIPFLITGSLTGEGALSLACSAQSSRPRLASAALLLLSAARGSGGTEAGDGPRERR